MKRKDIFSGKSIELKRLLGVLFVFILVLTGSSCGSSGGGNNPGNTPVAPPPGAGTPPNTPTGVIASAGDGQIVIIWDSESSATSYNIYWATTSGVTKTTGTKISNVASPYLHTSRINNTTYYYIITAMNTFGESGESGQVSAIPKVGATNPLSNHATSVTDTSATISGSFYNPNTFTTTAWFEYGPSISYGYFTKVEGPYAMGGNLNISAELTGLQERTTYHYRIATQNSAGNFYGNDNTFTTYITPTTLALSGGARALAIDSTDLYCVGASSVDKVNITGGPIIPLASGSNTSYMGAIAIDSTNLYWAEASSGTVKKVSKNGGTVIILAAGLNSPTGLAVDSTSVYWAEYGAGTIGSGAIKKVGINGGPVTTLASGLTSPYSIAVDSMSVYWTGLSDAAVRKVGINGGPVTTIVSMVGIFFDITVDSTSVYWTVYNGGTINKIGINGGDLTILASGLSCPYAIAVDSTNVYWTEYLNSETVKKVGINGGTVTTLAAGLNYPTDIAVDSSSVYWTEYLGGVIRKAPKSY